MKPQYVCVNEDEIDFDSISDQSHEVDIVDTNIIGDTCYIYFRLVPVIKAVTKKGD